MDKLVRVAEVKAFETKSGNTRFVLVDDDGDEYTTFRESIARDALEAEGKRARISYHEQERGDFTNVYLDRVEPLPVEAEDLFEDLKPFKELVAEDIRDRETAERLRTQGSRSRDDD